MTQPDDPVFLTRSLYRRRRMMDAARLLPVLGGGLFVLPVLWADGSGTAPGVLYLFGIWGLLIAGAAVLSRRLPQPLDTDGGRNVSGDGEGG